MAAPRGARTCDLRAARAVLLGAPRFFFVFNMVFSFNLLLARLLLKRTNTMAVFHLALRSALF